MLKHFKGSIIVTVLGFVLAWYWAEHIQGGLGLKALFITFFLSVLEVTLSFDNAVVNAMVLEKMAPKWQHRFLTWGILVAVFGMRFLFPVAIVSIFANLNILETVRLGINDVEKYTHYLHLAHAPLLSFGGAFLMLVGLSYFFGHINHPWIKIVENFTSKVKLKYIDIAITLCAVGAVLPFVPDADKMHVFLAGLFGIALFGGVRGLCAVLEKSQAESIKKGVATGGLWMFIYLEIIDASFSLDGVLGSFAISKDIIIITIGLTIGAMFVRSLTLLLVEKKTLNEYVYLPSGAHWAILALAVIMLVSIVYQINEIVTGSLGLLFVGGSFAASLIENKRYQHTCNITQKGEVECD